MNEFKSEPNLIRFTVEDSYNPALVEQEILKFWDTVNPCAFNAEGKEPVYSIDTPPPTVSGTLHLGHVFSYSQAEFMARYKRMRGYRVFYPFGLDNNGLPTELLIEKDLGVTAEELGRQKFVEAVRAGIKKYNDSYVALFKRLGLSVDWALLYETVSPEVQKVSQKSFLELLKIGRIYRREAPVLFCPKCRTTVSQMELKDKTLRTSLVHVRFSDKVTIATTRPELLPACVAVFVNPSDPRYKDVVGSELKVPLSGDTVKVYADSRVDPAYGTGAVMCCTFGDQTDIEWYKAYGLGLKMIVQGNGRLNHPRYGEIGIRAARERTIKDLQDNGYVVKLLDLEHAVNVHERCDTEVEFIVRKQWYVRYLDLKQEFLSQGDKINWYPAYMKVRYQNWVNGLQWDWNISRQRFFGVYFPVWYCKRCGEPVFAKDDQLPVNPFSDRPGRKCSCGGDEFEPETDVMDTWATSSLTPLINARWGLDDRYMGTVYPMSLRAQAHDIISFWAFTTIVKSYLHTGSIPWRDIMISGHGLDSKGQPMHKSKGNVVYPEQYIEKYGADALRFWASSSTLGEDNSFQEKEVVSGSRLVKKLWNVARYVNLNCRGSGRQESPRILDKWIVARLNMAVAEATKCFERYDYYKARVAIEGFFWEFANDYLEFVKNRVYEGDKSAKYTMSHVLLNILKLLAPFIPFVTEYIYREVYIKTGELRILGEDESESIHLSRWPSSFGVDESSMNTGEAVAAVIRDIRKLKHDNKIPLNEAISSATVRSDYQSKVSGYVDEISIAIKVEQLVFAESNGDPGVVISVKR